MVEHEIHPANGYSQEGVMLTSVQFVLFCVWANYL